MNFYDLIQVKTTQISGAISAILGLVLLVCSCWVLHQTIQSESYAYYSYGLKVGALPFEDPTRTHVEAYGILESQLKPYVTSLKVIASLGFLSGIVQISSWLILFKSRSNGALRFWLATIGTSCLISLSALVITVTRKNLIKSLEMKIFVTVTVVTMFLSLHLMATVYIQLRITLLQNNQPKTLSSETKDPESWHSALPDSPQSSTLHPSTPSSSQNPI